MRKLYKFYPCSLTGAPSSLFIANSVVVEESIGRTIQQGCGVRSELVKESFEIISEDQEKINWLQDLLGESVSGFNPIEQYLWEKDICK